MSKGAIIAIVGPSGAGKDTLIDFAREKLAGDSRFVFVRRAITRAADAGGERHQELSVADFKQLADNSGFALWWEAHGLYYGIPKTTLNDIAAGRILLINGSRAALPAFRNVYGEALKTVLVTAPQPVLTERLAARGRESASDILARLQRQPSADDDATADLTIVNDRQPSDAGRVLVDYMTQLLETA
ncbi:phosphonate metabolism protein/1,5-bisphosphokinase (PRPP-forming) PhnN [Rhizobium sp. L1K21]|uniref:phosphonate metabolism protein/1,5-bisphosphokinase (PRPP-forming) PhnN n=1 Tax=Rhizobium sp. L1K21 TaxID=2954933 RepID=UPI002091F934|nr:phosphonate metabolism protein/1,5-bisphosphokinase (PRPP-forming) PhnN [Rhizobium sp. L1K21]MCO6184632.1 phosphonate metabolism protein/1,5-bisphosphokinase (PRPP-forming) PhnN [Rhizobium sp. L1K21]